MSVWSCPLCRTVNGPNETRCQACAGARPASHAPAAAPTTDSQRTVPVFTAAARPPDANQSGSGTPVAPGPPAGPEGGGNRRTLAFLGLGGGAVLLVVMAVVATVAIVGGGQDGTTTTSEASTTSEVETSPSSERTTDPPTTPTTDPPTTPPSTAPRTTAPLPAPAVRSITASATAPTGIDSQSNPISYDASNLIDGATDTAWRATGDATGVTITISLGATSRIQAVALLPGYAKVDPFDGTNRWPLNRRPTKVRWTFDDKSVEQTLADTANLQELGVSSVSRTVTVTILGVTPPPERDFTAISEIRIR